MHHAATAEAPHPRNSPQIMPSPPRRPLQLHLPFSSFILNASLLANNGSIVTARTTQRTLLRGIYIMVRPHGAFRPMWTRPRHTCTSFLLIWTRMREARPSRLVQAMKASNNVHVKTNPLPRTYQLVPETCKLRTTFKRDSYRTQKPLYFVSTIPYVILSPTPHSPLPASTVTPGNPRAPIQSSAATISFQLARAVLVT